VPQSIVLPPYYSFCPFPSTFSHLHFPFLYAPNLSPHYPSFLHTHHPLTSLLYKLYSTPATCNPWHKHPPLQQWKSTQTHTRATKPSSPHNFTPSTHPFSCPPLFSVTFTNSPKPN
jgi:hypothetical protein